MGAESSKATTHPIWSVLWRVAVLWVGVNLVSMFYLDGSLSPFTLDNLGKRSVAILFRSAGEFVQGEPLDIQALAQKHKLSAKAVKGFLYTRSRLHADLFNRYGQMGICALDAVDLMRLQLWQPYRQQRAADACLGWLQNLRGESLAERLEMFATTMDSADDRQAQAFADRVLNPQYRDRRTLKRPSKPKPAASKSANAAPLSVTTGGSTDISAVSDPQELPVYGPDGIENAE